MTCPFCSVDHARIKYEAALVLGLRDAFPITDGHEVQVWDEHGERWLGKPVGGS